MNGEIYEDEERRASSERHITDSDIFDLIWDEQSGHNQDFHLAVTLRLSKSVQISQEANEDLILC